MYIQIYAEEVNIDNYFENYSQSFKINPFRWQTLFEGSIRAFFPYIENWEFLTFINIGYGWNYEIIYNIVSPGIMFDLSIGTDFFWLFNDNEDMDVNTQRKQFAFGAGARFYNKFQFLDFMIIPFIGCNFMFLFQPLPMTGVSVSFKNFGLEYAYYFKMGDYRPIVSHHLSVKYIVSDYRVFSSDGRQNF